MASDSVNEPGAWFGFQLSILRDTIIDRVQRNRLRFWNAFHLIRQKKVGAVDTLPDRVFPGQWPESPDISPTSPTTTISPDLLDHSDQSDDLLMADETIKLSENKQNHYPQQWRPPPHVRRTMLSKTMKGHSGQLQRLPLFPDRKYWPSWYKLDRMRRETGLDYPSTDEDCDDVNDMQLPSVLVKLSRRGEVFLQARLQEALEKVSQLQGEVKSHEQQSVFLQSEVRKYKEFNEHGFMKLRADFDQAVKLQLAEIEKQRQTNEQQAASFRKELDTCHGRMRSAEHEKKTITAKFQQKLKAAEEKYSLALQKQISDHERALAKQRDSHKTILNGLIEDHLAQCDDNEKEYERELAEKIARIHQLEVEVKRVIEPNEATQADNVSDSSTLEVKQSAILQKESYDSELAQQAQYIRELEERCAQQERTQAVIDDIDAKADVALSEMQQKKMNEREQKFIEQNVQIEQMKNELEIARQEVAQVRIEAQSALKMARRQALELQHQLQVVEKARADEKDMLTRIEKASHEKDEMIGQLQQKPTQIIITADDDTQTQKLQQQLESIRVDQVQQAQEIFRLNEIIRATHEENEKLVLCNKEVNAKVEHAQNEAQNMLQEKASLIEENRRLSEKVQQLLSKPERLEKVIEEHKVHLDQLNSECVAVQSKLEQGQNEIIRTTEEKDQLSRKIQALEEAESNTAIQHQAEIALLEEKLRTQELQLTNTTSQQHQAMAVEQDQRFQADLNQATEQANRLHQLQTQTEQLQDERQEAINYALRLKSEREQGRIMINNLNAQCRRFEEALDKKEEENQNLQGALHDFEAMQDRMRDHEGMLNFVDQIQVDNNKLKEQARHWKGKYQADLKGYQEIQKENAILHSHLMKIRPASLVTHIAHGGPDTTNTSATPGAAMDTEMVQAATQETATDADMSAVQNQHIQQLTKHYESRLQQERIDRAKAEQDAIRFYKLAGVRGQELFKLRRLDNITKQKLVERAEEEVAQAKTEAETALARQKEEKLRAEEAQLRADLIEAEAQRARENMQEHINITELHFAASQRYNANMQTQEQDLNAAKQQVSDARTTAIEDVNVTSDPSSASEPGQSGHRDESMLKRKQDHPSFTNQTQFLRFTQPGPKRGKPE